MLTTVMVLLLHPKSTANNTTNIDQHSAMQITVVRNTSNTYNAEYYG